MTKQEFLYEVSRVLDVMSTGGCYEGEVYERSVQETIKYFSDNNLTNKEAITKLRNLSYIVTHKSILTHIDMLIEKLREREPETFDEYYDKHINHKCLSEVILG